MFFTTLKKTLIKTLQHTHKEILWEMEPVTQVKFLDKVVNVSAHANSF